jgi:hypothetical protein
MISVFGGLHYDEILITLRGLYLGRNFDINVRRPTCGAKRNLNSSSAISLDKNDGNFYLIAQSQDPLDRKIR